MDGAKYDSQHDSVFLREPTANRNSHEFPLNGRLYAESRTTELIGANSRNGVEQRGLKREKQNCA